MRVPGRCRRAALLVVLVGGGAPGARAATAAAQASAALEAGVSQVDYDGFLPSGAASITPSLTVDRPWASLSARGTALLFESGNTSLQGALAMSLYARLGDAWRGEIAATAGGSRYADVARFWHGLGRARVHRIGEARGVWLGGMAGRTSYGIGSRAILGAEAGAWVRIAALSLSASATRTGVGDTTWTDLEGFARLRRGALQVDAAGGARVLSNGAGRGVYAEIAATRDLTDRLALTLSGGRYPTDPIRGSIAGRYVSAGLKMALGVPHPPLSRRPVTAPPLASGTDDAPETSMFVELVDAAAGRGASGYRIVIHAPGARAVEVMGDFTDWEPVALVPGAGGSWTLTRPLAPGVHRLNIRLDGGPWLVPAGATAAPDDFGGRVGIFVVEG